MTVFQSAGNQWVRSTSAKSKG